MNDLENEGQSCFDEYETVVNNESTYNILFGILTVSKSVFFSWTEGECTQLDIMMSIKPAYLNRHLAQGGLRNGRNLFVSIMRFGSFAFDLDGIDILHPSYVGEKLGLGNNNSLTTIKLCELIKNIGERLCQKN